MPQLPLDENGNVSACDRDRFGHHVAEYLRPHDEAMARREFLRKVYPYSGMCPDCGGTRWVQDVVRMGREELPIIRCQQCGWSPQTNARRGS